VRILVVDDEALERIRYARLVRDLGHDPVLAETAEQALAIARLGEVDVLLVDWVLHDASGLHLVVKLRRGGDNRPMMIITRAHDAKGCERAFKAGADEFAVKTPDDAEVRSRLARLVERHLATAPSSRPALATASPPSSSIGPLRIDRDHRTVWLRESGKWERVALTHIETQLLLCLAHHVGQVLPIRVLLDKVWGSGCDITEHTVEVVVSRIRKKLGPARNLLATVPSGGYRLGPSSVDDSRNL
jgi:two-component system phosphate regulon response regulator PhoB